MKFRGSRMQCAYASFDGAYAHLFMRTHTSKKKKKNLILTTRLARLRTAISYSILESKLGKICVQIDAQDVYIPMKQISLKNSLWIKSYVQNSK